MTFQPTNTEEWVRDQTKKTNIHGRRGRGRPTSGPVASRNNQYPPPTTAAERVALANRQIVWLNTDLGYRERYYSNLTDTGAVLRNSAKVAGWYPYDIDMPHLRLDYGRLVVPTIGSNVEYLIGNSSPANMLWEETYDPHGWFTPGSPSTQIVPTIPGHYRCFFHAQFNTSTGGFWATVRRNSAGAGGDPYNRQMAFNGAQVIGQPVEVVAEYGMNGTTDYLECTIWNGSGATNASRGFFLVEYVRPLQVVWAAT